MVIMELKRELEEAERKNRGYEATMENYKRIERRLFTLQEELVKEYPQVHQTI